MEESAAEAQRPCSCHQEVEAHLKQPELDELAQELRAADGLQVLAQAAELLQEGHLVQPLLATRIRGLQPLEQLRQELGVPLQSHHDLRAHYHMMACQCSVPVSGRVLICASAGATQGPRHLWKAARTSCTGEAGVS